MMRPEVLPHQLRPGFKFLLKAVFGIAFGVSIGKMACNLVEMYEESNEIRTQLPTSRVVSSSTQDTFITSSSTQDTFITSSISPTYHGLGTSGSIEMDLPIHADSSSFTMIDNTAYDRILITGFTTDVAQPQLHEVCNASQRPVLVRCSHYHAGEALIESVHCDDFSGLASDGIVSLSIAPSSCLTFARHADYDGVAWWQPFGATNAQINRR